MGRGAAHRRGRLWVASTSPRALAVSRFGAGIGHPLGGAAAAGPPKPLLLPPPRPQFHLARALTWFAILVRVAATEHWRVVATLAAGALTTLLPAFADHLPQQRYLRCHAVPRRAASRRRAAWHGRCRWPLPEFRTSWPTLLPPFLCRWRLPIQISDNVLQVALGVYTHHVIYPSKEGVDPTAFQVRCAACVLRCACPCRSRVCTPCPALPWPPGWAGPVARRAAIRARPPRRRWSPSC